MKIISIIIPILNEEIYIKQCLESILQSDYPKNKLEILLVDGMSNDNTRKIIKEFQHDYPFIMLLDNPNKIVPVAMNIGIKNAHGDYIIRLDAHSIYPNNYFRKLIYWHKKLDAANIGTPIITDVKNKTLKSNSIKKVLSNKFGVGNSFFRTGTHNVIEVDTVPFGCYKKDAFAKYGLYDERLIRNQDIELNKRIINNGGKIYLIPDTACTYFAREDFSSLAKNNFSNGLWNVLTAYYSKNLRALSLRHFIPLFFVLSLLIPFTLGIFFHKSFFIISFFVFFVHFATLTLVSLKITDKDTRFIYLIISFYTLHFSYGIGSIAGIIKAVLLFLKNRMSSN